MFIKPPRKSKVRYDEYYAKIVLEVTLPNVFQDIFVEDKPDLRCYSNNIGIEVVGAENQTNKRRMAEFSKAASGNTRSKEKLHNEKVLVLSLGINIEPHNIQDAVIERFVAKLERLRNEQYAPFARYDLLIHSDLTPSSKDLTAILDALVRHNIGEPKYTNVYLLTLTDLYVYDLQDKQIQIYPIDNPYQIASEAKKLYYDALQQREILQHDK